MTKCKQKKRFKKLKERDRNELIDPLGRFNIAIDVLKYIDNELFQTQCQGGCMVMLFYDDNIMFC